MPPKQLQSLLRQGVYLAAPAQGKTAGLDLKRSFLAFLLTARIEQDCLQVQESVQDFASVQWDEVAEGLGAGRTPAACLAQYQRRQKRDALLNSKWTPEEATRLAKVIAKLGTRDWQARPGHCSLASTLENPY